ncbi:uncharacterized protein LOC106882146 isoform X2 [Octopus bimaculoides]|nr:uncharacterized protein LOC106882146 isoform X2 [Octopus bimaculoides]XP_052833983.1 uncharacterized protein LOC106882146 isoform X2 [Octopus bimaculoides]XP_052833984.1 uncharacterized protein LOC106882146 isoform X2 [Octopus bimaculoides]XP_052833985.1 uncharacterized protein LOC106882146 isoform X2 [Octopus bimaculoides]XP_052833986.1 uncharacterized protein LOC106882146 isoform X2 [Octopus bimaculoides]
MDMLQFFCVFTLRFYLTNAQIYKIFRTENVVLNGNITLHFEVPNMERPVTWRCGTRKYKCDDTCYNGYEFKVTQSANSSSLWIRNVTKELLSCTCYDNNQNSGKFDLERNSLTKAEIYEIIQNDNGTLDVTATLQIEIPNMKRPTIWKYNNYKYECDRTCANSPEYRVTQSGNVSTFRIQSVTKERLSWKFEDYNLNYGKFDLKIHSLTRTEIYNITQSGPVALGGNVSLYIDVYDMKRIVVWKNYYGRYECDTACYNHGNYEVTQNGNSSNLLIRNVTKKDLTWRFCDFYLCSENYTLETKGKEITFANNNNNNSFQFWHKVSNFIWKRFLDYINLGIFS